MRKITFRAADGLPVTADLYESEHPQSAVFILCHQAGFNRGEYIETAQYFLEQGFTCMALDQRSGGEVNGVINETHRAAVETGKPTGFADAAQDIEAAIFYANANYPEAKKVLLGSSYSASLAIIMGVKHAGELSAVISFSPGEYFELENKSIEAWAKDLNLPVFITSAKVETNKWAAIFEAIPSSTKTGFKPTEAGVHGSRNLWTSVQNHQEYRDALEIFINHSALTDVLHT